ncbi:VOC family protein [Qingshengfaniella alkalisoli]|uniref:VOC family protein n=1 Tax=Qingshengfaniella alkalisoli TaxID=2599296 RepID=A0A5B8I7L6_9RHOB|nr:VOC family protein [Qingshengfaniella alkalisoli]QDY69569.1 VOC family protein [Qingshengfaniella alkalisoli]
MKLDHLVISAADLDAATAEFEERLGVSFEAGGKHPLMGTHNRLLSLGPDLYLEIIAIDSEAADPNRARWFSLDRFSGPPKLTNWVVSTDALAEFLRIVPEAGEATQLSRGDLRWEMAIPANGSLPCDDIFPALIQWEGEAHPAKRLPDRACRLASFSICHPQIARIRDVITLRDDRVVLAQGMAGLSAILQTPRGLVKLG